MTNALETEEIAARWLIRQEEIGWSDADKAALDVWLDAAPENRVAYWRLEYGWQKADRLASLGQSATPARAKVVFGVPAKRIPAIAASLAACLVAAGGLLLASGKWSGEKDYKTGVGGHQTVALVDGTRVELNTATMLRTAVTGKSRAVWLDEGEAYFEVAHDPNHPFVIHAGKRTVTVLGTKFSVRREGDHVEVAVIEGRVRVEELSLTKTAAPIVVTRGDIVLADGKATLLAVKSVEKVNDALSWRDGRLTFDQVTLADAASEFNRYNRKKLIIADPVAANIRIGGSFDADNVDTFTRLLKQGFGLKVVDDGDSVTVSE